MQSPFSNGQCCAVSHTKPMLHSAAASVFYRARWEATEKITFTSFSFSTFSIGTEDL